MAATTSTRQRPRVVCDLRKPDVRAGQKQQAVSEEIRAELVTGYTGGASIRKLSEQYDIPYGTVRNTLKSEGVALRTRGGVDEARRMEHQLGPDKVAEIVELAKNGAKPPDLADEFNVGLTAMYRLLTDNGGRLPGQRRTLQPPEVRRLYRMADRGKHPMEIAAAFDVATGTVTRYLEDRPVSA
jgi:transposase-like protein